MGRCLPSARALLLVIVILSLVLFEKLAKCAVGSIQNQFFAGPAQVALLAEIIDELVARLEKMAMRCLFERGGNFLLHIFVRRKFVSKARHGCVAVPVCNGRDIEARCGCSPLRLFSVGIPDICVVQLRFQTSSPGCRGCSQCVELNATTRGGTPMEALVEALTRSLRAGVEGKLRRCSDEMTSVERRPGKAGHRQQPAGGLAVSGRAAGMIGRLAVRFCIPGSSSGYALPLSPSLPLPAYHRPSPPPPQSHQRNVVARLSAAASPGHSIKRRTIADHDAQEGRTPTSGWQKQGRKNVVASCRCSNYKDPELQMGVRCISSSSTILSSLPSSTRTGNWLQRNNNKDDHHHHHL